MPPVLLVRRRNIASPPPVHAQCAAHDAGPLNSAAGSEAKNRSHNRGGLPSGIFGACRLPQNPRTHIMRRGRRGVFFQSVLSLGEMSEWFSQANSRFGSRTVVDPSGLKHHSPT